MTALWVLKSQTVTTAVRVEVELTGVESSHSHQPGLFFLEEDRRHTFEQSSRCMSEERVEVRRRSLRAFESWPSLV